MGVDIKIVSADARGFLAHVQLAPGDKQFLLMIAERGGEIEFNKEMVKPAINARIAIYVEKQILTETPLIGRVGCVIYRLTDLGRNLCEVLQS